MSLAAVILAAGLSNRFGSDKLRAPWGPDLLLPFFLKRWPKELFTQTVVVTSADKADLVPCGFDLVINSAPERGQGSSIALGAGALKNGVEGVVYSVADMPRLSSQTVERLVRAVLQRPHQPHALACGGRLANPVYFPARLISDLRTLAFKDTGKVLLKNEPVIPLEAPDGETADVDSADAYRAALTGELFRRRQELIRELLPKDPATVAFVGGGGKTSTIYNLARGLIERGDRVVVTTTTRMGPGPLTPSPVFTRPQPGQAVLWAGKDGNKLTCPGDARRIFSPEGEPYRKDLWILVEADGSKRLPIKAPADHEPVIPTCSTLVWWCCNPGRSIAGPMGKTAHRPQLLTPLTGCMPDEILTLPQIARLAWHVEGGHKGLPPRCRWGALLTGRAEISAPLARLIGDQAYCYNAWPQERDGLPLRSEHEGID